MSAVKFASSHVEIRSRICRSDFISGQPDNGYGWTTQNASAVATSSAVSSFTSSSASDTPTSSSDFGLSTGAAAGIGVAVGVGGALLLGALAAWCYLRRRRQRMDDDGFTVATEPHHGYQAPSSASPDRTSGVVPYMSATTSQGAFKSRSGLVQQSLMCLDVPAQLPPHRQTCEAASSASQRCRSHRAAA